MFYLVEKKIRYGIKHNKSPLKNKKAPTIIKGYVPHCRLDDSVCLRLNIFFRRFLDFVIRFSAGLHTYLDVDRRC